MADDIMGTIDSLLARQARVSTILNGDPEIGTPGLISEVRALRVVNQALLIVISTMLVMQVVILGVLWSMRP